MKLNVVARTKLGVYSWLFGPKLFISFLSKERIMTQKCYREMGNFWSTCPKASIEDDFKTSRFWDWRFWSSMGFDRLEAVASLDAYQITNCQFLSKIHHFCCLISEEFERVSKLGVLWPIA